MVKIGILGVGTVGASVAKILEENADIIEARAGKKILVKSGVVKNLSKDRGVSIASLVIILWMWSMTLR